MSRIQGRFEALAKAKRKALIPYITAGDPHPSLTVPLMRALVESGADILEELQPGSRAATPAAATLFDEPLPDPVLDALGHDPVTLDAIGARTGWSAAELAARLLDLELEGRVARLPGGLYQRRASV